MKASLKQLEEFSYSMAKCLSSGIGVAKSLELSGLSSESKSLRRCVRQAIGHVNEGATLSGALGTCKKIWPHFFVPVIRCGEESGRIVEAFNYLCDYCRKLIPAAEIVRKTWLYPVVLIIFGWSVRCGLYLVFDSVQRAGMFFLDTFVKFGVVVAVVAVFLQLDIVKTVVDLIQLQLPFIREAMVDFSTDLFFRTFNLMYRTGGIHMAKMVEMASQTLGNSVVRKDFMRSYNKLLAGGSVQDGFAGSKLLKDVYKKEIAVGSLSGELDRSLDTITRISSQTLTFRLTIFTNIFCRIISYTVAMGIVATILALTM